MSSLANDNLDINENEVKVKVKRGNNADQIVQIDELMFLNHTRNQLIKIIGDFDSENKTLKRQLNSKFIFLKIFSH